MNLRTPGESTFSKLQNHKVNCFFKLQFLQVSPFLLSSCPLYEKRGRHAFICFCSHYILHGFAVATGQRCLPIGESYLGLWWQTRQCLLTLICKVSMPLKLQTYYISYTHKFQPWFMTYSARNIILFGFFIKNWHSFPPNTYLTSS